MDIDAAPDAAPDIGGNNKALSKCGNTKDDRQCEAEGCRALLQGFGRYCMQRRLCPVHLKAIAVRRKNHGDQLWRFCQQCGKLEQLSNFEGQKRSCMMQLARRRAGTATRSADGSHRQSIKQSPGSRYVWDVATRHCFDDTSTSTAAATVVAAAAAAGCTTGTGMFSPAGSGAAGQLPQQFVRQDATPVLTAAQVSGVEDLSTPAQQGPHPDLPAVWQQLGPFTLGPQSSAEELEQQRMLLERKVAVIDTQMALLQEQEQLESQLLTLHQQFLQRQQELQSRLQHTQQQMLLLTDMQPDLPAPPCLQDGCIASSSAMAHMPPPAMGSFTASAAGMQAAAAADHSTALLVPQHSAGQAMPAVSIQAVAELLLAQAKAHAGASGQAARQTPTGVNHSCRTPEAAGVHDMLLPAAAGCDAPPVRAAAGPAGLQGSVAVEASAVKCEPVEAAAVPSGSVHSTEVHTQQPCGGQPLPAAAAWALGGASPGAALLLGADAGAASSSTAAGVSPFSAAAGVAAPASEEPAAEEPRGAGNGAAATLGCHLAPHLLVDKGNSLEAFASVLQMALTETEAVFSVLDSSMSFPFKLE